MAEIAHVRREPAYFSRQVARARRFYLGWIPRTATSFTVLSGGWEECQPNYRIHRPGFPHPTLEFVARGAGSLVLNGRRFALSPGTVFVYGRGVPHEIRCDPARPMLKYFVVFAGPDARTYLRWAGLTPGSVAHVRNPESVSLLLDELIAHALGDHPDRMQLCATVFAYALLRIGAQRLSDLAEESLALIAYRRCRTFIEQHAAEIRRLDDIARACHLHPTYVCRLFQRFERQSPMRYVRHLQLSRAAERLLTESVSIKALAADLGYSDSHNFTRAFRRTFGVAPQQLRSSAAQPITTKKGRRP